MRPRTPRLALGTAQFGLAYGIGGRDAPVDEADVRRILERAARYGVTLVDTAPAYGDIEQRLKSLCSGLALRVISKVAAIPATNDPARAAQFALESAQRSLDRLGELLEGLLLHNVEDLLGPSGDHIWQAMESFTLATGVRIGVSCYGPGKLNEVRARYPVRIAQLPGNAFDQRLTSSGPVSPGIELHLRSVFLQGLLLMPERAAAVRLPVAAVELRQWHHWLEVHQFQALDAALALVKALPGVAHCIVGVDSLAQLESIIAAWDRAQPVVATELGSERLEVIDPRLWRLAS